MRAWASGFVGLTLACGCKEPATPLPRAHQAGQEAALAVGQVGPAVLEPGKALAEGVDGFPRVKAGAGVTEELAGRIDRQLDQIEAKLRANIRLCAKAQRELKQQPNYSRSVSVTMAGPNYLSLVADDEMDCGGAHSQDQQLALVYDLRTGRPLDWLTVLPSPATGGLGSSYEGVKVGTVQWPLLLTRELQTADLDCRSQWEPGKGLDTGQSFLMWLDVKQDAVVASPVLLNHFDSAMCGQPVILKEGEARRLGVKADVLDSLHVGR